MKHRAGAEAGREMKHLACGAEAGRDGREMKHLACGAEARGGELYGGHASNRPCRSLIDDP
jgi:hypothetical protein